MGMIKKEVTGSAEELKLVKNSSQAPKSPQGGTSRPSFTGSTDKRAAGSANSNLSLAKANGLVGEGPVSIGDTSHSRSFTTPGNRGAATGQVRVASEDITRGIGGKFIKTY